MQTNSRGTRISGSNTWFGFFDNPEIRVKLPKRSTVKDDRIKIAVLDTGIDLENHIISGSTGRIQCWPSEISCKDTNGHGTQVAYLLMRLAPHAMLRISKVADSQNLADANVDMITKVSQCLNLQTGKADVWHRPLDITPLMTTNALILSISRSVFHATVRN
jgi:hypothetical protein